MAELPSELLWKWKIWWDPVPPEVFKELEEGLQREIIAVTLDAQAQMLRTQADALAKVGGMLGGAVKR